MEKKKSNSAGKETDDFPFSPRLEHGRLPIAWGDTDRSANGLVRYAIGRNGAFFHLADEWPMSKGKKRRKPVAVKGSLHPDWKGRRSERRTHRLLFIPKSTGGNKSKTERPPKKEENSVSDTNGGLEGLLDHLSGDVGSRHPHISSKKALPKEEPQKQPMKLPLSQVWKGCHGGCSRDFPVRRLDHLQRCAGVLKQQVKTRIRKTEGAATMGY